MQTDSSKIFLRLSAEGDRSTLHAGEVTGSAEDGVTVQFEESDLTLEPGQTCVLLFELRQKFMQQPATVTAVEAAAPQAQHTEADDADEAAAADETTDADDAGEVVQASAGPTIAFQTTGDPVSADSRQSHRVSTIISNRTVRFGDEESCPLVDISATGFAVISTKAHNQGDLVTTTLSEDGEQWEGTACVQSIREQGENEFRYGMYCGDDGKSNSDLGKGLRQLSMKVQREQLRRLSGAA